MKVKEIRDLISGMDDNEEVVFIHNEGEYSHFLDNIKESRMKDGILKIIIEDYMDVFMRD